MKKDTENILDERLEVAMGIFNKFNSMGVPLDKRSILNRTRISMRQNNCLEFIQFACPEIDARKLSSNCPSDYIEINASNKINGQDQKLTKLIRELQREGFSSFINIVLIDTDENDYVFPVVGTPENLNSCEVSSRKLIYFSDFQAKWRSRYGISITTNCFRWSEIRDINENTLEVIDPDQLKKEIDRLKQIFSKGNYYNGWKNPSDEELEKIAELKFKTYADQGYQLARYFPNAILIQNEFPLELRTKMLNLLNDEANFLPAIYPYGTSDSQY